MEKRTGRADVDGGAEQSLEKEIARGANRWPERSLPRLSVKRTADSATPRGSPFLSLSFIVLVEMREMSSTKQRHGP